MLDAICFFKIMVCLAGRTNPENKISYICDFSRCRLNVRVKTFAFNLCSEVTNVLYLSFWVLFVGNKHTPEFQLLKKPQPSEISLKSSLQNKFFLFPNPQRTVYNNLKFFLNLGFYWLLFQKAEVLFCKVIGFFCCTIDRNEST